MSVREEFRELRDRFFYSLAENRRFISEDAAVQNEIAADLTKRTYLSNEPATEVSSLPVVEGLGEYERATQRFNVDRSNLIRVGAIKASSKSKSKVKKYELAALQQNLGGINKRNAFFNLKLKRHWEEQTRSQQS